MSTEDRIAALERRVAALEAWLRIQADRENQPLKSSTEDMAILAMFGLPTNGA